MERGRRRGHSFYEEDGEEAPPVGANELSVSLDGIEYDNQDDENVEAEGRTRSRSLNESDSFEAAEEEEEEDEEPVGRSRSRSRTHLGANERGIIPVVPGEATDPKPRSGSLEPKEKTGPLTQKEFDALRQGLEEATTTRNQDQLREEEEEKIAAKEEESQRLAHSGNSGDSSGDEHEKGKNGDKNGKNAKKGVSMSSGVLDVIGGRKSVVSPVAVKTRPAQPQQSVQQKYTQGSESTNMRRFKVLLLGDSGVGKSSLIFRWTEDRYSASLVGTVGVNFKTKKVSVEGEAVTVQVWDTAGQEQFHKITTSYYRGANAIMVVYDISDKKSLENVEYWIKNIKAHAAPSVHVVLVGNKTDLRAEAAAQAAAAAEEGGEGAETTNGTDDAANAGGGAAADSSCNNRDRADTGASDYTDEDDDMYLDDDYDDYGGAGGEIGRAVKKIGRLECIDFATGEATAARLGVPYFETSAKDSSGTDAAFMNVARIILGYERMAEDDIHGVATEKKAKSSLLSSMGLGWGSSNKDKEKDKDGKDTGGGGKVGKEGKDGKDTGGAGGGKEGKEKDESNKAKSSMLGRLGLGRGAKPAKEAATNAAAAPPTAPAHGDTGGAESGGSGKTGSDRDSADEKEKKGKWFSFT